MKAKLTDLNSKLLTEIARGNVSALKGMTDRLHAFSREPYTTRNRRDGEYETRTQPARPQTKR
jgi:hypothetical protein